MRVFGPNGGRSHSLHSILRASVEADSSQNLDGGARSPRRASKKHKNLEHSACNLQRLQNSGNDCENRERHRAAGKKEVERALPGEEGVRKFCSKDRCVGGKDRPSLARLLESRVDCMHEIDYTQDFSEMVDRNALVSHLLANGFKKQGSGRHLDKGTILDNTSSVGDHVCTWINTVRGHTARTKIYNKAVSQFEAGEVTEPFGGHLADYVDCPNQHMRRAFEHPAVQARGCTRIEMSFYGSETLSARTGEELVAAALEEVQVENEENGLFVVQPPARQWGNLAKQLNCCFLVADRPQETVWMGCGGNTKTGRLQVIVAKSSTKTLETEGAWERAILCRMADFGYRNCPIFQVEILGVENDEVEFSGVCCFQKNAPTILAASRRPWQLRPGAPDPKTLLPLTEHVEWVCPLWEIPEIAANREISTLSTRNRAVRLEEILDEKTKLEWAEKLEEIARTREEAGRLRSQEIEQMWGVVEAKKRLLAERAKIRNTVQRALSEPTTKKLREVSGKHWKAIGHRGTMYGPRVVLEDEEGEIEVVYSTKQLTKLLENTKELFFSETERFGREMFFAASENEKLKIQVQPTKSFYNEEGKEIFWNPIVVDKYPDPERLEELAEEFPEHELEDFQQEKLQACTPPKSKDWKNAIEMEEGCYMLPTGEWTGRFSYSNRLETTEHPPKTSPIQCGAISYNKRQTEST